MLSDVALAEDRVSLGWDETVAYGGTGLLIIGPAGTGKTTLLASRFMHLAEQGPGPERIVLLAPTPARADALRVRLERQLERGYEELLVVTPRELAAVILRGEGGSLQPTLAAGDRLAMLVERIDELSLQHHDIGGSAGALLGGFIRKIDRLKAELISAEEYASWAATLGHSGLDAAEVAIEREFAEVYRAHERMLADAGSRDDGDLIRLALRVAGERPAARRSFEHLLIDDAHELDLAPARLARAVAGGGLTVAGDPRAGLRRFRGAGAERMQSFRTAETRVVELERSWRCPANMIRTAGSLMPGLESLEAAAGDGPGEVAFWRCANDRAQAQAVAADVERLIARGGVAPGAIAVLVPGIFREGQAVAVALEERAVPHRLIGEAAFFQRAEIRDVLAWLRLLADPTDAGAVVRALARPPINLRSVDIARCTQIARRRKLDMVAALAAATESPQVPPEARERIRVFLKLYRSGAAAIDTTRPDLYVHRLIERLGLRRQQLFAAHADVVERLRALAHFGELASAYVGRAPQATPREFARSIAAVADYGLREQEEPALSGAGAVQVLTLAAAGGLEADHVFVLGLHAGLAAPIAEPIPEAPAARADRGRR